MSALQKFELTGVAPRQQWSLFPYASTTYDRIDQDAFYKAGLDVFWRPSSNFQLTATANPDFGTVETDDVTVNLTADETIFPEKRLFFQEGQEIFNTTPRSNFREFQPFFLVNTRRIGGRPPEPDLPPGISLSDRESLKLADLNGAAKVTGQFGSLRYGALSAFENDTVFAANGQIFQQDGRTFATFRALYEDSINASYRGLGVISTAVTHADKDAYVHGIDFHYLTSGGQFNVDGQLVLSDVSDIGSGKGALVDFSYTPRQGLRHSTAITKFDDKLDVNDFGFQRRNNYTEASYLLEWVKSGLRRIRDVQISPFILFQENGEGQMTDGEVSSFFEIVRNNLDSTNINVGYIPSRFDDRNSFGNGTFKVSGAPLVFVEYQTNGAKDFSVSFGADYRGEDVGGNSIRTFAGVNWRPRQNVNLAFMTSYQRRDGWLLHQSDANFTTFKSTQWQPELNLEFFPTARQHFRLALQWIGLRAREDHFFELPSGSAGLVSVTKPTATSDDFSISQLNFQLRYRWQIAPLSDLFVVYTKADVRQTILSSFGTLFRESWNSPLGDQLVVKLRYRLGS